MNSRLLIPPTLAILSMLAACAATSESWRSMGRADFPVRVSGIEFSSGNSLRVGNCLGWGTWSTCYGSHTPVATLEDGGESNYIAIKPLRCRNAVEGEVECAMVLWKREQRCALNLTSTNSTLFLWINCPRANSFAAGIDAARLGGSATTDGNVRPPGYELADAVL
jgi:hypothetical protein